ncbi:MAG: nicotinate-nucleotide adenylyltransferase [Gemmatimonadetes bacterium]|nr:nicotinate-nucleotide adenylyltransferase [Gemmatimonadota bacterium]
MAAPEGDAGLRLGVFGGTFDPPHVGHVAVAREVADRLRLDRVIWMPAGAPPHKPEQPVSPAPVRLEMTRAAAAGEPRFEVSELEIRRPGPSYTVDTLRELRGAYPGADLFLILGADQIRTFATGWREPGTILELATLALMDRAGDDAVAASPDLPGMERAAHVPVPRVDVSSTEVRALVAAGGDVSALVPAGVLVVMEREGLYRG